MKKILLTTITITTLFFLNGCSGKQQINPLPETYKKSNKEKEFDEKIERNKELKASFEAGKKAGYDEAKEEIKKIIPYLDSLRASALLKKNSALCLPPVFVDKSDKTNLKLIVGKAHICDKFTIDNIFEITKKGIPGLPNYVIKSNTIKANASHTNSTFASSITIDGAKEKKEFIEKPKEIKKYDVKILNNFTSRKILRESNYQFSNIDSIDNYLIITFDNLQDKEKFCKTYKICQEN